jgi:hypothetical protein
VLNFIGNYFKQKKERAPKSPSVVVNHPSRNQYTINYDPHLISELESDHGRLVELYGRIWSEGFEVNDYAKTASLINQFKSDFQAHLLTENVKFYVYLEQSLSKDKHNLDIVREFRTDMNDIANAAVKFCKKYSGNFNIALIQQFKEDYTAVGEVLTRRVSLEEKSLYVLYQPH